MSGPMREFKLFDVQKYREIQSTAQGIANKSASAEQSIALIDQACLVMKTASFQKYNGSKPTHNYESLQEMRDILQVEGLPGWQKMEHYDLLSIIIYIICCPHYKETMCELENIGADSNTAVDYTEARRYIYSFSRELHDILDIPEYSIEQLPSDVDWMGIFSQRELAKITKLVSNDTARLLLEFPEPQDEKYVDDESYPDWITYIINRNRLIDFYKEFKPLLELANSQSHYTIHGEVLYG